jgi:carbamoyltransferase
MTMKAAGMFLDDKREMPHMLVAAGVAAGSSAQFAAVTHIDGTTRPQTVELGDDQDFLEILLAVGRRTGVQAVVNTSFNAAGLPLVATLRHAIADAFATPIDVLIVEDVRVKRRGER